MAIADEGNCPLGLRYLADDFTGASFDQTTNWTSGFPTPIGTWFDQSGGSLKPKTSATGISFQPRSFNPAAASWKLATRVKSNSMDGFPSSPDAIHIGITFAREVGGGFRRGLLLRRQSTGLQKISTFTAPFGGLETYTDRVTGIAAGTEVALACEGSGGLFKYWYNGALIHSEVPPAGAVNAAYFQCGLSVSSVPPFSADARLLTFLWAYYWPFTGAGGGPCDPWAAQAAIFPAATARPSHVRILRGHRSPDEARAFHNVVQGTP